MLIFLALLGCQPEVSTQSDGNRQALNQNNAQTIALLSEITVQDLVITEIMHNPEVEADWRGEWFEIYNAHTDAVDLQGLEVASANDTGFVVSGELIVQPGEYAVFANTSAADSNGGNAEVDYQYNYADLRFWDADSLSIAFQTTTFDSVSYDSAYPVAAGKSLSANVLDGSNNDTVDAWCRASSVYGDGDYGTPGFANDQCLTGDALTSGDLLITEIMHNPEAVADWKGEWFEIQNTSGLEINLNGLAFAGGSGGYTSSFSISDNLYLAPNAYFVFAVRAGDNGGLTADYYYDYNQMRFLDAGSIALSASGVVVDEVSWDSTWSLNSGVSLNLASQTSSSTLNDSSAYWCDATSTYGDGDYGTPGASNTACTIDQDGDGFGALDGDCDDSNADVNSDAMEVCDGVDNDCDGLVDEDDPNVDLDLWYLDFDGDGYGAPSSLTIISCSDPNEDASYLGTPYVRNADDCDDFDISIYPGAEEIWYDGVDQNCDQASDFDQDGDLVDAEEDCDDFDAGLMSFIDDGDCDGVVTAEDCDDTDDTVTNSNLNDADCDGVLTSEDCDDADASVTNSNMDDADCDGVVTAEDCDDTDPTDAAIFNDCDQDGSLKADDCNDSNPTIYPGAPELCDGLDNACTGSVPTNEDDADNDGYVECTIDSNGWQGDTSIVGGDDCDDIRPYIYVGAAYNELTTECTRDQDGDGWGAYAIWAGNIRGTDCDDADAGSTYEGVDGDCDGVVTVDDCDDADATVYPGASEIADDGIDQDCDGVDETSTVCGLTSCDTNLDLGGGQSMDLVLIPNGTFTMGSPSNEVGRLSGEVQHQVTLTNDYYVMTTEVTQGMFAALMGYNSYDGLATSDSNGSYGIGNDYPAYHVSWHMAADFANTVTQRHNTLNGTNLQECYACSGSGTGVTCSVSVDPYQCNGYRMLTEAEWEYAARAGTTAAFWTPNGGGNLPSGYSSTTSTLTDGFDLRLYGHYSANNNPYGAKEVAQLLPNDYGLYDMSGNLWEWTQDWYGTYSTGSVTNPTGISSASSRVIRGGYWYGYLNSLRSAERNSYTPTSRDVAIGFRLSRISLNILPLIPIP